MICKICNIFMKSGTHYEIKNGKKIARRYDECPRCHFCQYNNRNNTQEKLVLREERMKNTKL